MAIGHGGQILLSRATRDLVDEALPPGAGIRALGTHRLKDLAEPTEVYQLVHPDLQAEFPPLKSLDVLANNLPTQTTRFIGRQREVAAVRDLASAQRLLTLSGTGGAGKTRLALQVAADLVDSFKDGVWLVEMGPVADPALVPQAVASVLSVREEPGRAPISALVEFVRTRQLLVLLDSCEHVVQACAELANTLLRAAPEPAHPGHQPRGARHQWRDDLAGAVAVPAAETTATTGEVWTSTRRSGCLSNAPGRPTATSG